MWGGVCRTSNTPGSPKWAIRAAPKRVYGVHMSENEEPLTPNGEPRAMDHAALLADYYASMMAAHSACGHSVTA